MPKYFISADCLNDGQNQIKFIVSFVIFIFFNFQKETSLPCVINRCQRLCRHTFLQLFRESKIFAKPFLPVYIPHLEFFDQIKKVKNLVTLYFLRQMRDTFIIENTK